MLSCKNISKLASQHIDQSLPFTMKMKVKFHLFICRDCRNFIKRFNTTIKTIGQIEIESPENIDMQIKKLMEASIQIKQENLEK